MLILPAVGLRSCSLSVALVLWWPLKSSILATAAYGAPTPLSDHRLQPRAEDDERYLAPDRGDATFQRARDYGAGTRSSNPAHPTLPYPWHFHAGVVVSRVPVNEGSIGGRGGRLSVQQSSNFKVTK